MFWCILAGLIIVIWFGVLIATSPKVEIYIVTEEEE